MYNSSQKKHSLDLFLQCSVNLKEEFKYENHAFRNQFYKALNPWREKAVFKCRLHCYFFSFFLPEPIFLRSPGIHSNESIPPTYVAGGAGTSNRVVVPARQAGTRFLGFWKCLQIGLRLHRLGELIPWIRILGSLKVWKYRLINASSC